MMHQRELDHERARRSADAHDLQQPGRTSASSALASGEGATPSGILARSPGRFDASTPGRDAEGVAANADSLVGAAASSAGQALPEPLREQFESTLGHDLSGVRVHTGAESAAAAESVNARAYAVGSDIHFGAGEYDPHSREGQRLVAHEVVHTVQQAGGAPRAQFKLEVSTPGDAHEQEADALADRMVSSAPAGGAAGVTAQASGTGIHRWRASEKHGFRRRADVPWVKENPACPWNGPSANYIEAGAAMGPQSPAPADIGPLKASGFPEPLMGLYNGKPYDLPPGFTVDKANAAIDALEGAADGIVGVHNATAASVRSYNDASKEVGPGEALGPAPDGVNWDKPKEGTAPSVGQLAEQQKPHQGKTSIGDLYGKGNDVQGVSDKTVQAAKKEDVSKALEAARGKDQDVKDAVIAYGNHISEGIGNAARGVADAYGKLSLSEEEKKKEDAEGKMASLVNEKNEAIAIVSGAATLINKTGKVLAGDVETVREGIVFLADKCISAVYESQINAQKTVIEGAKTKIKSLQAAEVGRAIDTAWATLNARIAEIGTKRSAVARAVKARQDAYDDAAKLAEKHAAASGKPGEADRLRTAIAAIPRIELVLARVGQVTGAAVLPGYDSNAGLAYAVAKKSKGFPVGALEQAVGAVKGYKQEFDNEHGKWQGRLDSAKKIAAGLNVSGT
jgi:hypothetical protein